LDENMDCPHLEDAKIFICHAKPGALMAPNEYELTYYCLTPRYSDCPVFKKHHRPGKGMQYNGTERRKYQRFRVAVPVDIGLVDLKKKKTLQVQFKGVTTDISLEGLGLLLLLLNSQISGILPFASKMVGKKRHFNLEIIADIGRKKVRSIGEVKWTHVELPSLFKMGVSMGGMREDEKQKWTDFVISHGKNIS
jgi:hypothetical protein